MVDPVTFNTMASSRTATHDADSSAGLSPFLNQQTTHATFTRIKKYTPVDTLNTSKALQLADVEDEAKSPLPRPRNPFGDETYPASAGSSVRSKILKASRSIDSESEGLSCSGAEEVVHDSRARIRIEPYRKDFFSEGQPEAVDGVKRPFLNSAFKVSENMQSKSANFHQPIPGPWARVRNHAVQSTVPEDSTIDNILRQYKGSDVESMTSGIQPVSSLHQNLSQLMDESTFLSGQDERRGHIQVRSNHISRNIILKTLIVNRYHIALFHPRERLVCHDQLRRLTWHLSRRLLRLGYHLNKRSRCCDPIATIAFVATLLQRSTVFDTYS